MNGLINPNLVLKTNFLKLFISWYYWHDKTNLGVIFRCLFIL